MLSVFVHDLGLHFGFVEDVYGAGWIVCQLGDPSVHRVHIDPPLIQVVGHVGHLVRLQGDAATPLH